MGIWDADPEYDEQAGEEWLFLLPEETVEQACPTRLALRRMRAEVAGRRVSAAARASPEDLCLYGSRTMSM